ncbi:hypothetical protein [Allosediminivita pacifica]|uniref:DUF4148 domain-containing protein n=1 Tax=Allosediminivita pacifica TaxID=1267769 RepID=A0A2T6A0Q1_9RHOB|nr:hypothetical protein [Allosediminivita pacifica]PTX37382.1 hypothetical protein C8N44_1516 [Allosediminivita pacifica]GGB30241.1 hypothetical protein GCM10011324_44710 [Allosediminivita pacifica]
MKTVFASALVAATALTGAAYAATPAQLTEIQKYAPNADVTSVTDREAALALSIIRSGDNDADKRQEVRNLLR